MSTPKAVRAAVAARRTRAVAMRTAGHRWDDIARELGYASRAAACKDVTRALEANVAEQGAAAEVHREQALERLDALTRAAWQVLTARHLTVSHGKVIHIIGDDGTEEPLVDDAPVLAAVDRLVRIEERRAKLLGTDAPTRLAVTGQTITYVNDIRVDELEAGNG